MSLRPAQWPAKFSISDWTIGDASIAIDEYAISQVVTLRLRSVVGERGKLSGVWNGAHSGMKPERNDRRRAADGSLPRLRHSGQCPLVTSARFAKWNWCGREGDGDEPATRGTQQNRALVTANLSSGVRLIGRTPLKTFCAKLGFRTTVCQAMLCGVSGVVGGCQLSHGN